MGFQKSGRAKWQSSYLFDSFSKDNGRSSRNTNGPVWLEKSLSEARDSEEETMSISVSTVSSFLRGQNVPVDPMLLAERESKRRKALELQQAIKQQLEERENLKKIEQQKQYQWEKAEEERLARQIELERERLEYERHLQNEKLETERKKQEAMRQALERASMEAQMERERKRREKVLAMQSALDETISIQKIGERTEIHMDGCQKSQPQSVVNTPKIREVEIHVDPNKTITESPKAPSIIESITDEDDGETMLIGTPIKLKKKNLEAFRRKIQKRQSPAEDSKNSSDEESTPKTTKSIDSNNEKNSTKKAFADLDGIALVLQTMPIVPFVPISNDFFAFNQLNNFALLMAAQNGRINSPNLMLPLIKDLNSTASTNQNDKFNLSQFIIQQSNNGFQLRQTETPNSSDGGQAKIITVPPTPDLFDEESKSEISININTQNPLEINSTHVGEKPQESTPKTVTPTIPHDGTFTKEEAHASHDAFTSTSTENQYVDEEREVKILTPQKYRNELRIRENMKTVETQTESFLFCEYCLFKHQHCHNHHYHHCSANSVDDETDATVAHDQENRIKTKEKTNKTDDHRPLWGVRQPPIKYQKASERDPWKNTRKKRYLKKAASESDKADDGCKVRDCPLIKASTPLLKKRFGKLSNGSLSSNLLPIKTNMFGQICLLDEQSFIRNEAFKRLNIESDTESSIDIKHKSFFLPKAKHDFQDIFVD